MSSATGKDVKLSVEIINFSDCEEVRGQSFEDRSNINPGIKIFTTSIDQPIYRGLNIVTGNFLIKMKKNKRPKRKLELRIKIYATNMRARETMVTIQLAQRGFSVSNTKNRFLY